MYALKPQTKWYSHANQIIDGREGGNDAKFAEYRIKAINKWLKVRIKSKYTNHLCAKYNIARRKKPQKTIVNRKPRIYEIKLIINITLNRRR